MVEQFNLRTKSPQPSPLTTPNVIISSPIIEDQEITLNGHTPHEVTPPPENTLWKESPLYSPGSSDEEGGGMVADVFHELALGGLPSSDTMSSDVIVNSISNG